MINGEKLMENKELKLAYESLKRVHASANDAIISLQKQNADLQEQVILAQNINASLEKQVNINKGIMHQTLTESNEIRNKQAEEIQRLRGIIRELKGG